MISDDYKTAPALLDTFTQAEMNKTHFFDHEIGMASLSVEDVLQCSIEGVSGGCLGGSAFPFAEEYIKSKRGLGSWSDRPYLSGNTSLQKGDAQIAPGKCETAKPACSTKRVVNAVILATSVPFLLSCLSLFSL